MAPHALVGPGEILGLVNRAVRSALLLQVHVVQVWAVGFAFAIEVVIAGAVSSTVTVLYALHTTV